MADQQAAQPERGVGAIWLIISASFAATSGSLLIGLGWALMQEVQRSALSWFGVTMLAASLVLMGIVFASCLATMATAFGIVGGQRGA